MSRAEIEKAALARITRARSRLIAEQPFFGVLCMHLAPRADWQCQTFWTDGEALGFNPDYALSLSEPETLFTLAHEACHCAYSHFARIGNRDLPDFNKAADYALNGELIRLKIGTMPEGILHDAQYAGLGAEEIYSALQAAKRKQAQPKPGGAGQPSQGAGAGAGQPQPSPTGAPGAGAGQPQAQPGASAQPGAGNAPTGSPAPGNGQAGQDPASGGQGAPDEGLGGIRKPGSGSQADATEAADKWQVIARQAAAVAKAANAGTMPGFAERIIADISKPEIDCVELLASLINSRIAVDYSFSRPNRRLISAGFYLPGIVADALDHLVFAVDTSGSIDNVMLARCAGVIIDAMESGKVRKLTVIFADASVRKVQEFELGDDIKLVPSGGGGTKFSPTFRWIEEHAPDATAILYLTDMECNDWGAEPDAPVYWAVHGDSRRYDALAKRAPFGESVYIGRLG